MTKNKYLQILELQPGVSKKEIKQAYRRLSKKYHPDVSKDPDAKEKFISIHEAYKFLTDVGAHPAQHTESSTAYDYNAHDHVFEEWRRKAREYARRRAADAEAQRNLLIKQILSYFNYAALVIGLFDIMLMIDYLIPYQTHEDSILHIEKIFDRRYSDREFIKYLDVSLNTNHMRLTAEAQPYLNNGDAVVITSTSIFNTPVSLESIPESHDLIFEQAYSVYRGFGFLIPIVITCFIFYIFFIKNQENRFSLAIVLFMLFVTQIYIFVSV